MKLKLFCMLVELYSSGTEGDIRNQRARRWLIYSETHILAHLNMHALQICFVNQH